MQHCGEIFEIKATGKYAENAWQYGNTSFYVKDSVRKNKFKNCKMLVHIFWFGFQLTQITFINRLLTLGVDESLLIPLEFRFDERHGFLGNFLLLLV